MPDKSISVDRRTLIFGLRTGSTPSETRCGEIASILVQTRPERLAEVKEAIVGLGCCEVHGCDARGKLVVVVDAPGAGVIGSTLNMITIIEGVLSASLVFHAVDAAAAPYPGRAS